MTIQEFSEILNISVDAKLWQTYNPIPSARKNELCTDALLERLELRFGMFGEYFDAVKEGLADLENYPKAKQFMDMVSLYIRDCTTAEAKAIPYPDRTDTAALRMLPLLVHLPSVENLYDSLCQRGFTHEQACHTLSIYRIYLWETQMHRRGYVGITPFVSQWMSQFTKGEIYYPGIGGLNFQIYTLPGDEPYILRNRKTAEILPIFGNDVVFCKGGKAVLGSVGTEDPEESFTTHFYETENAYIGNPTRNCLVSPVREEFLKSEWELILRPGDNVITTHIFWGSDFSPDVVKRAFAEGQRIAKICFPECHIKAQRCCSWLMNPLINDSLGENSKLSQFSSMFVRYPRKSAGKTFVDYVFPGHYASYEELPENSSLQRAFKKHLLKGEYIYEYSGILVFN